MQEDTKGCQDLLTSTPSPLKRSSEEDCKEEVKSKRKRSRLSLKRKNKEKLVGEQKIPQFGQGNPATSPFHVTKESDENYFTLEVFGSKSFHKSELAQEITYRAKLKHPAPDKTITDLGPHLYALFQTLIDEMIAKYGENGVARIYIDHPNLEKAIIVVPTPLHELFVKDILDHIDNVVNSAGDIPADNALDINVAVIKLLQGSGRKHVLSTEDLKFKRSLVTIKNNDNSCLPRSIAVGLAHLNMKLNPDVPTYKSKYEKLRNSRNKAQTLEAEKLRIAIGISLDKPGSLHDIPLYEQHLQVGICVISLGLGNKRVYNGSSKYKDRIFLLHSGPIENGHFDTITSINGMMNTQYYCEECGKGFKNRTSHNCKVWCKVCGRKNCKITNTVTCCDCNKICRSEDCFLAHKKQKTEGRGNNKGKTLPSLCEQVWQCPDCGVSLKTEQRKSELHECGEIQCDVCNEFYLDEDHQCYMRSISPDQKSDKFIFYDFECQQDNAEGEHVPNYVVAHTVCNECEQYPIDEHATCNNCGSRCNFCSKYNKKLQEWERSPCNGYGKRQVIFSGPNTKYNFCKWLIDESHKDVTAIAHNGRAYDAYFIYNYLMSIGICPEPAIFSGSKIMYMYIQKLNLRLLDSLNFLPMPLAKLPKSFDLKEMKKGFSHTSTIQRNMSMTFYHVYQICNTMTLIACQKTEGKSF